MGRRLLRLGSSGYILTEFSDKDVPPYAILSHTWEADDQELTLQEISQGQGREKRGFRKVEFCQRQAAADGLAYFWIDSCCINKTNSVELAEAINSMFRWYSEAVKCYVYMSDVPTIDSNDSTEDWKQSFKASRWFTRGWTLQETIAPKSLEFFSNDGARIGDRQSLIKDIHLITDIPYDALRGTPSLLSQFPARERISWSTQRITTREEDGAYSLLGLCGVYIAPLYGEGRQNAMRRLLRELDDISSSDGIVKRAQRLLDAPNPSNNYRNALSFRHTDTGLWFTNSERYEQWRTGTCRNLWIQGIPGCGKTVLFSTILQNMLTGARAGSIAVAYFYFDFNDQRKQDPSNMLRSLISQLAEQSDRSSQIFAPLLSVSSKESQTSTSQLSIYDLLSLLHQLCDGFSRISIMLDALDESSDRALLMHVIGKLLEWRSERLHIMATHRQDHVISKGLQDLNQNYNVVTIERDSVDTDINSFVRDRLENDPSLGKWSRDSTTRRDIESTLTKGSQGMFRWAICQLDALRKCRTRRKLQVALQALPPTLDETYDRVLLQIAEEDSNYALHLLQWLATSVRPMTLPEAAQVIAIDPERSPAYDSQDVLQDPSEVLDICSSLITTSMDSDGQTTVFLAHYSVKEYLTSSRIKTGRTAHFALETDLCQAHIAKCCLSYILQLGRVQHHSNKADESLVLAGYTTSSWMFHARAASQEHVGDLEALILALYTAVDGPFTFYLRQSAVLANPDSVSERPDPLYHAAMLGFPSIVDQLIQDYGADVDRQDSWLGSALHAASAYGHMDVVTVLIEAGADVNAVSGFFGSALQCASSGQYLEIVEVLLKHQANVNQYGGYFGTALIAAATQGLEEITILLLQSGADPRLAHPRSGNALYAASRHGHLELVRLLLTYSSDINATSGRRGSALYAACRGGHEKTVELLLSRGASADVRGGLHHTAMEAAAVGGHVNITAILAHHTERKNSGDPLSIHVGNVEGDSGMKSMETHSRSLVRSSLGTKMTRNRSMSRDRLSRGKSPFCFLGAPLSDYLGHDAQEKTSKSSASSYTDDEHGPYNCDDWERHPILSQISCAASETTPLQLVKGQEQ